MSDRGRGGTAGGATRSARKILRISRWEVTKGAGGVSRGTIAVGIVTLVFVAGIVPFALSSGVALDTGIYRVGITEDSPYHPVVEDASAFTVREPSTTALRNGDIDLLVTGGTVRAAPREKSQAALAELRRAVESYNDDRMLDEENQSAAFPVSVTLGYAEQDAAATGGFGPGGAAGGGTDGGAGGGSGDGTAGGAGGSTGDGGAGSGGAGSGDGGVPGGGAGLPNLGGIFSSVSGQTPSSIQPPFPFASLVLAFVFVLPLNFVIQAYGSSMLSERLKRRGELLLVAPVSRFDIIAGKTLPYFAGSMLVTTVIVLGLRLLGAGAGPISVLAILPLALLFLAVTFLGAMMARSFKELTFVTVTASVFLTSYAFIPAVFTNVGPVSLISPLTLVVRDLAGDPVTALDATFAVLPATLTGLVLFGFGAGLYREEDMFTQRPLHLKVLDALAGRIRRRRGVFLVVVLLMPFVFVAELLAIATLYALPVELSLPVIFVTVAIIEEAAKSLPVYAGYVHNRFERTVRSALVVGALSGLAFFVAEKFTLIAQLVGLDDASTVGQVGLATGTGIGSGPLLMATLLLAPLALHVVTATCSAVGGARGREGFLLGYVAAVCIHTLYNLGVVVILLGGLV